jgi:hypothetical protein
MPPAEMVNRVGLLKIDVSEERITSIISMTRIGELQTLVMKNGISWYVTQCGSCKNPCFGGT